VGSDHGLGQGRSMPSEYRYEGNGGSSDFRFSGITLFCGQPISLMVARVVALFGGT